MSNLPTAMSAVLLKGNGEYDQLEFRADVPVPEPAAGEVLIRIGAAGVNNTDINTRTDWYSQGATVAGWTGAPPVFPRIQGADGCGRIVAVGEGVDASRIGERVLVEPVFREAHRVIYFGSEWDGAFAEYAKAPAVHAHRIDSSLSDTELATFPCSYSAAENMLARAKLSEGETVLITGASGGVGSAALQLAKRRGAKVIAIAGQEKAAEIMSLGASQVLSRDTAIAAALGAQTVDVVCDVVGGAQFPDLLEVMKRGGRYAVSGAIAGPHVDLDLRTLYLKDLKLFGCTVFEPSVFTDLIGYIERGEIKPLVSRVFPLSSIVEAQKEFMAKRHIGKIVLKV
jgi:NADPH:quinone reductase-like Zn-dependent oxidoreductase